MSDLQRTKSPPLEQWERDILENGVSSARAVPEMPLPDYAARQLVARERLLAGERLDLSRGDAVAQMKCILGLWGVPIPAPKLSTVKRVTLADIGQALGKDARTVRRYCERGMIPGAFRTRGGHWRIRAGAVSSATFEACAEKVQRFSRNRRNPFRARRDPFKSPLWSEMAKTGAAVEACADLSLITHDAASRPLLGGFYDLAPAAREQMIRQPRKWELVSALVKFKVWLGESFPKAETLAEMLGVSLRTFRARYSRADVKAACRIILADYRPAAPEMDLEVIADWTGIGTAIDEAELQSGFQRHARGRL